MNKWTRVKFQPNLPLKESGRVTASKEHILLSKEAAKEGMVLLKMRKICFLLLRAHASPFSARAASTM